MTRNLKMLTNGDSDKIGADFPLNSTVIILTPTENKAGTLVDKTGVTANTTARDLLDSPTAMEWFSKLTRLTYSAEHSSLQIKL